LSLLGLLHFICIIGLMRREKSAARIKREAASLLRKQQEEEAERMRVAAWLAIPKRVRGLIASRCLKKFSRVIVMVLSYYIHPLVDILFIPFAAFFFLCKDIQLPSYFRFLLCIDIVNFVVVIPLPLLPLSLLPLLPLCFNFRVHIGFRRNRTLLSSGYSSQMNVLLSDTILS